jgi:sugar/nucleoside kinase (ribokinase family)
MEGYLLQNYELVDKAMELAREAGMEISLDLASYNVVTHHLDHIRQLCSRHVDILFANEEEGRAFALQDSDGEVIGKMADHCPVSILKLGPRGSQTWFRGNSLETRAIPAQVLDTTGAGDIFAAGFLAGYAQEREPSQALVWGSSLASEIIQILGARLPDGVIGRYRKEWGL